MIMRCDIVRIMCSLEIHSWYKWLIVICGSSQELRVFTVFLRGAR